MHRIMLLVSKLLWLVVFGLVVIYIYSVGAFAFVADEFHDPDSSDVQLYCNSLLQCWITIIHYILIGRGSSTLPTNFKDFAIRVIIFEVSFYFIITIIGINFVYAIVVDTFIDLRDEWWKIERDSKQICFICQQFSSEFEKKAKGFDYHIMNDHYMFDYVYFKFHSDKVIKDPNCIPNAMEWYINKMVSEKKIDFFPLHRARSLKKTVDELQEDQLKSLITEVLKTQN